MLLRSLILIIVLMVMAEAQEYAVVTKKNLPLSELSKKELRGIYLKKIHFINGHKIVPVNLGASVELRNIFEQKVLQISRQKLNKYWVRQHFQGIRPPVVQSSPQATVLFVKNVDGAIGYIPLKFVDADLKVLYEF